MTETLIVNFDGGSRGNPGPAGIGVVLAAEDSTPLVTIGKYIGRPTNNVAEYMALIIGLQQAAKLRRHKLHRPRRQRTGHQTDARRISRQKPCS